MSEAKVSWETSIISVYLVLSTILSTLNMVTHSIPQFTQWPLCSWNYEIIYMYIYIYNLNYISNYVKIISNYKYDVMAITIPFCIRRNWITDKSSQVISNCQNWDWLPISASSEAVLLYFTTFPYLASLEMKHSDILFCFVFFLSLIT